MLLLIYTQLVAPSVNAFRHQDIEADYFWKAHL